MTHPYREELAGRLELMADERPGKAATLREAAAALRQSPTVEEVGEALAAVLFKRADAHNLGYLIETSQECAQAIADLYGRRG